MLRERTTGTLERLMSMPVGKLDLLAGYGAGVRGWSPLVQAAVAGRGHASARSGSTRRGRRRLAGGCWRVGNALLGVALGLFVSAFARSEFQAVQFMPAVVLPQLLLCGLFVARDQMAGWLWRRSRRCCR